QQRLVTSAEDGRVRVWPIRSDAPPLILPHRFWNPTVTMASGDRIFVDDAESVSLWELSGELIQRVGFPHRAVWPVQATVDGRLVAVNGGEEIWETTELRPLRRPPLDSAGELSLARISPDGRYLFGSATGMPFGAWDVSTGRQVWKVDGFDAEYIPDIAIS